MITNKVRQASQSLSVLLEYVRAQMVTTHLLVSIMTPGHLKELLLRIQAELAHHLRLSVDLTEESWKYYNALNVLHC